MTCFHISLVFNSTSQSWMVGAMPIVLSFPLPPHLHSDFFWVLQLAASPLVPGKLWPVQASPAWHWTVWLDPLLARWQAGGWNWKTVGWLASRIRLAVWEVDQLAGWLASLCGGRSVGSSAWLCVHMAVLAEIKRAVQSRTHSQHNKHSCGNKERLSHQTPLKIMTI